MFAIPRGLRLVSLGVPALVSIWSGPVAAAGRTHSAFVPIPSQPATASGPSTLQSVRLPGGVEGIRRALGDRTPLPPATVGLEIARRFYGATHDAADADPALKKLIAWLRSCQQPGACTQPATPSDAMPLPGPPELWRDVVFEGRAHVETIAASILADRRATLLYVALLSFDDATRAWMVGQRDLLRRLSSADAAALVIAAPYVRIVDGAWRLPGGQAGEASWVALAGSASSAPAVFLPALLSAYQGFLAYALEVAATLSAEQRAFAFGFDRAQKGDRVAASRRFVDALRVALPFWRPAERPFWRPASDPAFLLAQLPLVEGRRWALPAGRRFWAEVLNDGDWDPSEENAREAWRDDDPLEPAWLVTHVFSGGPEAQVTRYEQVLFGARWFGATKEAGAYDALLVLRAHRRAPELLRTLDRLGVSDPTLLAALVRRARALSDAGSDPQARAALAQWQSALMLLLRAKVRGGSSPAGVDAFLRGLAAGQAAARGGVLRSLLAWLERPPSNPQEATIGRALTERLVASNLAAGRHVTWEDAEYRLDFAAAERDRLTRVRNRASEAWLDAAIAALDLADGFAAANGTPPPGAADRLHAIIVTTRLEAPAAREDVFGRLARDAAAFARRRLAEKARRSDPEVRDALYDLADALGAAALMEATYAVSLGWAENLPLKADAASRRHVFTIELANIRHRDLTWASPRIMTAAGAPWHVAGSVLGLDVALAPVTLRRLSMKPLASQPTLSDSARQLFTTTSVLLDRRTYTDEAQQEVVALIASGRTRLANVRAGPEADALARDANVSAARRTVAGWLAATDRGALAGFFSLNEILRIGLAGAAPRNVDRWGNRETPVTGRDLCGPLPSLSWERYAGRWNNGLLAYAVPDLQLVLAAGLAEVGLPAVLVPDLMTSATLDFVGAVAVGHPDDWRAMVDWVAALTPDAIERYIGLLTTNGPLRVEQPRVSER